MQHIRPRRSEGEFDSIPGTKVLDVINEGIEIAKKSNQPIIIYMMGKEIHLSRDSDLMKINREWEDSILHNGSRQIGRTSTQKNFFFPRSQSVWAREACKIRKTGPAGEEMLLAINNWAKYMQLEIAIQGLSKSAVHRTLYKVTPKNVITEENLCQIIKLFIKHWKYGNALATLLRLNKTEVQ